MRSEQTVFDDLASLCASPGYIHALAYICFRDNVIACKDELTAENISHDFSESRLIRTETTTLIGLMMRTPIDLTLPEATIILDYVERTEALLEEMHQLIIIPMSKVMSSGLGEKSAFNPFTRGTVLRETIFYGPDSAYPFQYRDLAPHKYSRDADWLLHNKGIDLGIAREICLGLGDLIEERLLELLRGFMDKPVADWTVLPGFTFSCDELASQIGQPMESVQAFIEPFAMPEHEHNATFTTLHSFNAAYAYPLIRAGANQFIMLQPYGIAEALYEVPFYWMCEDRQYTPKALRHRGDFTEQLAAERIKHVFGADRVFTNVEIEMSKGKTLGEIDVLVLFGDRAIVLQAKSKRLTQLSRKGNDRQLQHDFRQAVQEAVDQAFDCSELLGEPSVTLRCRDGRTVPLTEPPSAIFPLSVVVDHYPALAFQARHLLVAKNSERIHLPLVIDVFALDAITEMLDSPLRFLSYLALRSQFGDKLLAMHELTLLSYHLKRNLWVGSDTDLIYMEDDVSTDLDVAMTVRRNGVSGKATPDGILTRFDGTPFSDIISQIDNQENPVAIDLGLTLLELNEEAVRWINEGIEQILKRTAMDGALHDMTTSIDKESVGLTIHSSRLGNRAAEMRLRDHCRRRKYLHRANQWFGIALRPDGSIRLAAKLSSPWKFDRRLEAVVVRDSLKRTRTPVRSSRKVGRNQRCVCGSGKKYKHCCIDRMRASR